MDPVTCITHNPVTCIKFDGLGLGLTNLITYIGSMVRIDCTTSFCVIIAPERGVKSRLLTTTAQGNNDHFRSITLRTRLSRHNPHGVGELDYTH